MTEQRLPIEGEERLVELNLKNLSSIELKTLYKAVDMERKRRGKRSPDNHDGPTWPIPKKAVMSNGNGQS